MTANMATSAAERISGNCARDELATYGLTSAPPITVPTIVDRTVADSSHAFAGMSFSGAAVQ